MREQQHASNLLLFIDVNKNIYRKELPKPHKWRRSKTEAMFCPKDIYVKTLKHFSPNIQTYLVHNMILIISSQMRMGLQAISCLLSTCSLVVLACSFSFSSSFFSVTLLWEIMKHQLWRNLNGVREGQKHLRLFHWGECLRPRFTTAQCWLEKTLSIWLELWPIFLEGGGILSI